MKKRILIVEDEISILDLLTSVFKLEGYEVLGAVNGHEALEISYELKPDVLVLDKTLYDIDGTEVCGLLKGENMTFHPKVLILSGCVQESDIEEAFKAKADAYITKPFELKTLVNKVNELLDVVES